MILYFVRHGESVANVEKIVSNRGYQHPLTENGRQQVEQLATSLQDIDISHIYTSPLQRAIQTAEILANAQQLEYEVVDALREGDAGVLEGRSDSECWQLIGELEADWMEKGNLDARIEGGESYNDIRDRFVSFVNHVIEKHSTTTQSILLVSHGAALMVGLPNVLTNVDSAYARSKPIGNASYIKAEYTAEGLVCMEWCGHSLPMRD